MRTPSLNQSTKPAVLLGAVLVLLAAAVATLLVRPASDDPAPAGGHAVPASTPGGHAVPASIPSDCSKDVERELSTFINALPNGSTVRFPNNGCYAQDARIEVRDKSNLTIDGNGSSFKSTAPNSGLAINPNWLILRARGVRLIDMKIVGNFHLTGTRSQKRVNDATVAGVGNQFNMGVGFYGGDGNSVTDTTINDVFGDGVTVAVAHYVEGSASHPLNNPRNVHIARVKVTKAARHCYSPSQAVGFWLEDSEGHDCWYGAFDAELDDVTQKLQNINLLRNTFSDFNMFGVVIPVAGNGTNTKDIVIRDNTFLTPATQPCNTIIEVGIYPTNPNTFSNVVIEGNTMKTHGVAISLDHVRNGRVSDNRMTYTDKGCSRPVEVPRVRVTNSVDVKVEDNEGHP